jgi:hypothetical protein
MALHCSLATWRILHTKATQQLSLDRAWHVFFKRKTSIPMPMPKLQVKSEMQSVMGASRNLPIGKSLRRRTGQWLSGQTRRRTLRFKERVRVAVRRQSKHNIPKEHQVGAHC